MILCVFLHPNFFPYQLMWPFFFLKQTNRLAKRIANLLAVVDDRLRAAVKPQVCITLAGQKLFLLSLSH